MKTIAAFFTLLSFFSLAQTKTSIQNGDFWNPLTWDCTCIPQDGDSLIINHDIAMSTGIAYTSGQILINSSGSLDHNSNTHDMYIDGGSLINYGHFECDGFLLDSGYFENNGAVVLDSLWTRDNTLNTGQLTVYDFAHDQGVTFTNNGSIEVTNNFSNQGWFYNNQLMTVANNYSNCNIQSMIADYFNNGILCIDNDFINCMNDTLLGSGTVYINGSSTNAGIVSGTITVNTPSGTFTTNTGTVEGTVNFGTASCGLGLTEVKEEWIIYPNPATNFLTSSKTNVNYQIYDLSGKLVIKGYSVNGTIHLDQLQKGAYTILLRDDHRVEKVEQFIKL